MDFEGNLLFKEEIKQNIKANKAEILWSTDLASLIKEYDRSKLVFSIKLADEKGKEYKNLLYFSEPKNLALSKAEITIQKVDSEKGNKFLISTDKLVKNLYLETKTSGRFSDNFFDLMANESIEIEFISTEEKTIQAQDIKMMSLYDTLSKYD